MVAVDFQRQCKKREGEQQHGNKDQRLHEASAGNRLHDALHLGAQSARRPAPRARLSPKTVEASESTRLVRCSPSDLRSCSGVSV